MSPAVPTRAMTPEDLRDDIPALESITYCNTGSSGPSPRRVVEAIADFQADHEFVSPAGDGMYADAEAALDDARATVAGHIGADPDEIALTQSTTDGINLIAEAIDWRPGDVVVRPDFEHSSGILPWKRLRDLRGIEVEVLETDRGRLDPAEVAAAAEGARLVCLSSLSWNYGTRVPVAEVAEAAHEAGAQVLVDAAQSPGQQPIDVDEWGVDYLAGTGHKWLLGPWGAGFCYVRESARRSLEPTRIGWRGVDDANASTYEYKDAAAMLEVSTMPAAVYRGLEAAIETIEAVGVPTIERHIERLTDRLKDGIGTERLVSPRGFESGLVSFEVDDPEGLVERLRDDGIVIRSIPYPECVRVSIHAFNAAADVDAVLEHV